MKITRDVSFHGWSIALKSKHHSSFNDLRFSKWGIAILYYKPEKRLSWSLWGKSWSRNYRLCGPKKLSFEK